MSQSTIHSSEKIGDLQVLRGVSILLVLCHHSPLSSLTNLLPVKALSPMWLGVEIFFLISGYVITSSLARNRYEPLSFLARRMFRLMPALLGCIAFCALLNVLLVGYRMPDPPYVLTTVSWSKFLALAASVVGGFYMFQVEHLYMFGPMWSLSVEDQFYAALSVLTLIGGLLARGRAQRILPALIFTAAACLYLYALFLRLDLLLNGRKLMRAGRFWNYIIEFRFDFLALGVILAFVDFRYRNRIAAFLPDRGPFLAPFLLLIPLGAAAVTGAPIFVPTKHLLGLTMPLTGLCFGALVLIAAHDRMMPPVHGSIYKTLYFLGNRSYSLYLFHMPLGLAGWCVLSIIAPTLHTRHTIQHGLWVILISTPPLFAIVELVYRRIELPLAAIGKRLSARMRILATDASLQSVIPGRVQADNSMTESVILQRPHRNAA